MTERERLIEENLPLAMWIANRWWRGFRGHFEIGDLKAAAVEGLLKAVDRYSPERGRLGAYASCYIRRELQRETDTVGQIVYKYETDDKGSKRRADVDTVSIDGWLDEEDFPGTTYVPRVEDALDDKLLYEKALQVIATLPSGQRDALLAYGTGVEATKALRDREGVSRQCLHAKYQVAAKKVRAACGR